MHFSFILVHLCTNRRICLPINPLIVPTCHSWMTGPWKVPFIHFEIGFASKWIKHFRAMHYDVALMLVFGLKVTQNLTLAISFAFSCQSRTVLSNTNVVSFVGFVFLAISVKALISNFFLVSLEDFLSSFVICFWRFLYPVLYALTASNCQQWKSHPWSAYSLYAQQMHTKVVADPCFCRDASLSSFCLSLHQYHLPTIAAVPSFHSQSWLHTIAGGLLGPFQYQEWDYVSSCHEFAHTNDCWTYCTEHCV